MTWWVAQWETRKGRMRFRVFSCLNDCDYFRERMWQKGIDPEYWML
jgi:hypothetical protein